jgi:hypothetical protein
MNLSRRRVMQLGIGGALALAAGGALSWVTLGYRLLPGEVPIALSAKELVVVRALADTIAPADGDLPGAVALGVAQRIDEEVWAAPDDVRTDLKSAIQLLEHLPPLLGFGGRFTSLSPADREACFAAMLRHDWTVVVQAAGALKQMTMLFTYARDAAWPGIGYDGPWVTTAKPPVSALRYAELLASKRSG